MEDSLGIIRVVDLSTDSKNVTAFSDVVLDVIVRAFVGELCHFYLFRCELLVQIKEVQAGWWQVLDAGEKSGGLELWHRRFKLRRDEGKWLVLHAERLVELN